MAKRGKGLGILAACALVACAHGGGTDSASTVASVGAPAPPWTEPSLPGPTLSLASLRGKAVYLNLFATWCQPCNEEAPAINALQRDYGARGLQVVGVDILENAHKAGEFRQQHQLSYPVIIDSGTVRDQYRVNGLPVHVFIGRDGLVKRVVVGEMSPSEMRSSVERLLQ
ncbi:MAG TPA: TlpA disulfide reductase family protein [Candidatus Cybelea sp.]|jgi:peroxiredoxin